LEKVRTGEICLWRDVRLSTTLQFIYARERQHDPTMRALLQTLEEVWHVSPSRTPVTEAPAARISLPSHG